MFLDLAEITKDRDNPFFEHWNLKIKIASLAISNNLTLQKFNLSFPLFIKEKSKIEVN